jgi:hypothetical protein
MPRDYVTLPDYPTAMVWLACDRCDRGGQYRKDGLIADHGADVRLPDLRHTLAAGCRFAGNRITPCGVYYVDLAARG